MAGTTAARSHERATAGVDARRLIARPVLPSGRAVVGGLLLAVAAVVTFTTWQSAAGTPDTSYAVAGRAVRPGERLSAGDLRSVPLELTSGMAARAFTRPDEVIGRVALGPIGEGELIQQGQLSDVAAAVPLVEVSFALARDRALDGQLRSGDRVDVFATYDDRTEEVVHGAQVVGLGGGDVPTLAPDDQVTVTVALEDVGRRAELVHAVRAGEVTLVRTTQTADVADGAGGADGDAAGGPGRPRASGRPGEAGGPGSGAGRPGGTAGAGGPGAAGGSGEVFRPDATVPGRRR